MGKVPDKIEIVVFICSACNKRSRSGAVADILKFVSRFKQTRKD